MWVIVVAVVAGAVLIARGRGGELSVERNDYLELELGPVSATDIALLRPPMALWGYNMQATDEALDRIAASIRERDVRIVALEQLVTDLSREPAAQPLSSPYLSARHRRGPHDVVVQPRAAVSHGRRPAGRQRCARAYDAMIFPRQSWGPPR